MVSEIIARLVHFLVSNQQKSQKPLMGVGDLAQEVECLPNKCKAISSVPSTKEKKKLTNEDILQQKQLFTHQPTPKKLQKREKLIRTFQKLAKKEG